MKALLVTSRVTFVPRNYDDVIVGLAACPQIAGLMVLNNADLRLLAKSVALYFCGARRVALTLLKNRFGASMTRRHRAFEANGKPVWVMDTINSNAANRLIREQGFDLIVNARTRHIYKSDVLALPRLGCINIHHGLLPEQRGVMCDLWALHEARPAGFSIHRMTEKLDDGEILSRTEVSAGVERDYLQYLSKAVQVESEEIKRVLREIEIADKITGCANVSDSAVVYRKTPTRRQIREMIKAGLKL